VTEEESRSLPSPLSPITQRVRVPPRVVFQTVPAAKQKHNKAGQPLRYVFSINSGRSGSKFLSVVLRKAQGIKSHHEHVPCVSLMREVCSRPQFADSYHLRVKKAQSFK
jgi:hypothetical protein